MTALAHERPETMTEPQCLPENGPGLDEVVWHAWEAMELPEGYRDSFAVHRPSGRW